MSVFPGHPTGDESQPDSPSGSIDREALPSQNGEMTLPVQVEYKVPPHIERALITLTTKMQHYIDRLETLELRIDELTEQVVNAPSHSDVLEVRLHSAKLAAELARATVELRGEIGLAGDEARRAARTIMNSGEDVEKTPRDGHDIDHTDNDDETHIDLTANEQQSKKKPWSQSA